LTSPPLILNVFAPTLYCSAILQIDEGPDLSVDRQPFIEISISEEPSWEGDRVVEVEEAFIISKTDSQFLDTQFYDSIVHFLTLERSSSTAGRRRRRGRRERAIEDWRRGRGELNLRGRLRGVLAALLVARKTGYRQRAIARYTVNGIEFNQSFSS
jgi:hypothetical protein